MKAEPRARQLARGIQCKATLRWFETLYQEAKRRVLFPWANLCPNSRLLDFWNAHPLPTAGKNGADIGCGLGDDAEQLAAWDSVQWRSTSRTAIRALANAFSVPTVEYLTANLPRKPPATWCRAFDFVFEANTLQVCRPSLAPGRSENMQDFLCPAVAYSSLPEAAAVRPEAKCPGLSLAASSPLHAPASTSFRSKTYSISKILRTPCPPFSSPVRGQIV